MTKTIAAVLRRLCADPAALAIGLSLATVAGTTGFVSYTHISALTLALGQSWKNSHLYPLFIDGQIVIGSIIYMKLAGRKRWLGLLGIVPGVAESLFANWESATGSALHSWLGFESHAWATVAAQAFAVSSFLFERWLKEQAALTLAAQPASVTVTIPEAAPSVPEPAAPAAPAGAGPVGLPVPVLGPAVALSARPVPRAVPRPRPQAAPRPAGGRLPLPEGEELAALLADPAVSANQMARDYDVSRWTANQMRKQFANGELVTEDVKTSAAAA